MNGRCWHGVWMLIALTVTAEALHAVPSPVATATPGSDTPAHVAMPDGSLAVTTGPPKVFGPGLHHVEPTFSEWISDYQIQIRDPHGKVLVEAPGYAKDDFKHTWLAEYKISKAGFQQGETYDLFQYGHDGAGYELQPLKKGQTVITHDQRELSDAQGDWGYVDSFTFDVDRPNPNVSALPLSLTPEALKAWRRQNTLALKPTPALLDQILYRAVGGTGINADEQDEARSWLHLHWREVEGDVKAAIDSQGSRKLVDIYHAEGGKAEWFLPEGCDDVNSSICQACAALAMITGTKPGGAKAARDHLKTAEGPKHVDHDEAIVIDPGCLENLKAVLAKEPELTSKVLDWILLNTEPEPGAGDDGKGNYQEWLDAYIPFAASPNLHAAKIVRDRLAGERWLLDLPTDDELFSDPSERPLLHLLLCDLGPSARYLVPWLESEWLQAKEPSDRAFAEAILAEVEPGVLRAHQRKAFVARPSPTGAWLKDVYRRPGEASFELLLDLPASALASTASILQISGLGHDARAIVSAERHQYAQSVSLPVEVVGGLNGDSAHVSLDPAPQGKATTEFWDAVTIGLSAAPKGELSLSLDVPASSKPWPSYRLPSAFFGRDRLRASRQRPCA